MADQAASDPSTAVAPSRKGLEALVPLRHPVFRMLWLAALASNIGQWMQTVGAQWFLLHTAGATATVPLVQAASTAPFLLLGVPAGVIGEFLNRRRVLIGVELAQLSVGMILTVLSATRDMGPTLLLTLTFLLGAASAVQLPAYQALTPELVPRTEIAVAATLSAASVNIGRVVGPAVAGVLIARAGTPWAFGLDAATSVIFLIVLFSWCSYRSDPSPFERPFDAAAAGLRYVDHSPVMRRLLMRLTLFLIPANAMWALLPLIADDQLGLGSSGYGALLGALGAGSLIGAVTLPMARERLGSNTTITLASGAFGVGLLALAESRSVALVIPLLLAMGLCWIWVVSSFSGLAQTFFPAWVRARGLSLYQLTFFGSATIGSTMSSAMVAGLGVVAVVIAAGVLVVVVALSQLRWQLVDPTRISRDEAQIELPASDVEPTYATPVMVLVLWQPIDGQLEQFTSQMAFVEEGRRRTGATTWALYRDVETPGRFHEVFTVRSWREHRDQHLRRMTAYDREVLDEATRLCVGSPNVTHHLREAVAR